MAFDGRSETKGLNLDKKLTTKKRRKKWKSDWELELLAVFNKM